MKKWLWPVVIVWSLILLIALGGYKIQSDFKPMGGDFSIVSTVGEFNLADYRNKVVVIYFGYRFCPDVCPTTLSDLAAMKRKLPLERQSNLQVLFISVDPTRDSMDVLREYVGFFDESFIGATSNKNKIDGLVEMYGAKYIIHPPEGEDKSNYVVDHSSEAFIVGKDGQLKDIIAYGESIAAGAKKLELYLKEKE